jgi:hypothetical protein
MIVDAVRLSPQFANLVRKGYSQDSFYGNDGEWTRDNRIEAIGEYFWRLDRLCIPRNSALCLILISEMHGNSLAGHIGVVGTLAKALDIFWWKHIRQNFKDFL